MRQNICEKMITNEAAETALLEYQANRNMEENLTVVCLFAQQCCKKSPYLRKIPESDREDVCQDVIVRTIEQIPNYDAKRNKEGRGTSVKAWINQMICSICNDELRRRISRAGGGRTIREFSSLDSGSYTESLSYEGWNRTSDSGCHKVVSIRAFTGGRIENPEDAYDKKFADKALRNAIVQLPERYVKVINLYYFEDRSVRDIAENMGASETAVKKVLDRARNKMRFYLEEYDLEIA